jgi:hypothetical protein
MTEARKMKAISLWPPRSVMNSRRFIRSPRRRGRGEDHYGRVFRVRCGPLAGSGTWDQFPQFRINHTVEWQRDYSAMGLTAD